jgi:hypothetical protein
MALPCYISENATWLGIRAAELVITQIVQGQRTLAWLKFSKLIRRHEL